MSNIKDFVISERKNALQNVLSKLVFVDDIWKQKVYQCSCCKKIAVNHVIAKCQDIFCGDCYGKLYNLQCPTCKNEVLDQISFDQNFEDGVLGLNVQCEFKEQGCTEVISLDNYLKHVKMCQFQPTKNLPKLYTGIITKEENQNSADILELKQILKELQIEIREINVQIKELRFKDHEFNSQLESIRQEFVSHKDKVEIEFANMKTEFQKCIQRNENQAKDWTENKMTEALRTFKLRVDDQLHGVEKRIQTEISRKIYHLKQEVKESNINSSASGSTPRNEEEFSDINTEDDEGLAEFPETVNQYLWKIPAIQQKLHDLKLLNSHAIFSPIFSLSDEFRFKAKAKLTIHPENCNSIFITLTIINANDDDKTPPAIDPHTRQFVLLDQSDSSNKKDILVVDQLKFRKSKAEDILKGCMMYNQLATVDLLERDNAYIKDDCILIEIRVMPLSSLWRFIDTRNGILTWKIENFHQKKLDEVNELVPFQCSDSFYTSENGYRMQVRLHLNGDGEQFKGKWISISATFLLGEFDHSLPCPFKYKMQFLLIDQRNVRGKKNHIVRELTGIYNEDDDYICFQEFVSHNVAERKKYLINDSIIVKVMVETS